MFPCIFGRGDDRLGQLPTRQGSISPESYPPMRPTNGGSSRASALFPPESNLLHVFWFDWIALSLFSDILPTLTKYTFGSFQFFIHRCKRLVCWAREMNIYAQSPLLAPPCCGEIADQELATTTYPRERTLPFLFKLPVRKMTQRQLLHTRDI